MTKAVGQDVAMIDTLHEVTALFEDAQNAVFKLMASVGCLFPHTCHGTLEANLHIGLGTQVFAKPEARAGVEELRFRHSTTRQRCRTAWHAGTEPKSRKPQQIKGLCVSEQLLVGKEGGGGGSSLTPCWSPTQHIILVKTCSWESDLPEALVRGQSDDTLVMLTIDAIPARSCTWLQVAVQWADHLLRLSTISSTWHCSHRVLPSGLRLLVV